MSNVEAFRNPILGSPLAVPKAANSLVPSTDENPGKFRVMPHSFDAEQGLLGAIMVNNQAYEKVSDFLLPEHFMHGLHARLFDAMVKLIERGQLANPVTLKPLFENDQDMIDLGGPTYMVRLASSITAVVNIADYGHLVYDLHLRRKLISIGEDMVNESYQPKPATTATDQIEATEQRLFELSKSGHADGGFITFDTALDRAKQAAEAAYKRDGKIAGVTTSFIDLDKKLGGLHNSDLIILAGRPSMGKTALATNIGFNVARRAMDQSMEKDDRKTVAFFSLEMSAEQLANRIISEEAGVSSDRIRRGDMRKDEFHRVIDAVNELSRIPFFIDDTAALSISALRTRARRLARQTNLGLIIIDYLQLMTMPGGISRPDNRVQEVSEISRGLKAIAKELSVPVIALSQLSRQVESRDDKRPQLSDLRESGSIEQDADVVMFVYREAYYYERTEPKNPRADESEGEFYARADTWRQQLEKIKNHAEVIVAKQRHGPIGSVDLHFNPETTKFTNYARIEGE